MPTFGSLFAGIGGLDLGLERAGWECRWQVEVDPFCQRVLAKHWPSVPRYGDIRALDFERVEPVDLVCGGFPCQPVSVAGKRLAQADERWLWPEFARVIRALRPRLVLVENVPGLLNRGIGDVLGDLASLGFDAEWSLLRACCSGLPHIRERVFIAAYPMRKGLEGPRLSMEHPVDACRPLRREWLSESDALRKRNGVPDYVERITALGNSVVPQVAEWIGRRLMEAL